MLKKNPFILKSRSPTYTLDAMHPNLFAINREKVTTSYFYTIVFNNVIAFFLSGIGFSESLTTGLVFSHCIGISICTLILMTQRLIRNRSTLTQLVVIILAIFNGALFGFLVASLICGKPIPLNLNDSFSKLLQTLYISLMCGVILTFIIIQRSKIAAAENQMQRERMVRIRAEKKTVESRLRMLQAQIEPHFLFNTLTNIISLMDQDTQRAKDMLMDLNSYLRASLTASRQASTTVGREIQLVRFYLSLFKVRMSERLNYSINVQDDILEAAIPPMLIQPLVENAIKHGLDPKIDGGKIDIHAALVNGNIRIEIRDTGNGFNSDYREGFGLSNIVERLESLYDKKARLLFKQNHPEGLIAILELPHEKN